MENNQKSKGLKVGEYIIKNHYISKGNFSKVYLAMGPNKQLFAAKQVQIQNLIDNEMVSELKNELSIYFFLNNQHIIKLKDIKRTKENIYIFLEYCDGETLESFLKNYQIIFNQLPSERIIQLIFKQIAEGLAYMSYKKCVHRDIKLENIMLTRKNVLEVNTQEYLKKYFSEEAPLQEDDDSFLNSIQAEKSLRKSYNSLDMLVSEPDYFKDSNVSSIKEFEKFLEDNYIVKIIDLGLAKRFENQVEQITETLCGTPFYKAPEISSKEMENQNEGDEMDYNYRAEKVDLWSFGVSLYHFTFGEVPFPAKKKQELYSKIFAGKYCIKKKDNLSNELVDLIIGLLKIDLNERYSWDDVINHPFFVKDCKDFTQYDFQNKDSVWFNSNDKGKILEKIEFLNKTCIDEFEEENVDEIAKSKFEEALNAIFLNETCVVIEFEAGSKLEKDDWVVFDFKETTFNQRKKKSNVKK